MREEVAIICLGSSTGWEGKSIIRTPVLDIVWSLVGKDIAFLLFRSGDNFDASISLTCLL